jgi:hypothetical protein
LAILPIGAYYGEIPELGGEASIARIQLEIAAADRRDTTFPRLVWVPKGIEPADLRQKELLKHVQEIWARKPFEVLELLPHQFQEVLVERLNRPKQINHLTEAVTANPAERPSVYVLAELQDLEAAQAVRQWLFENDFEVPGPPENWSDPAALREELRHHFMEDHAFLIYYGRTNEGWVRAQIKEISRAAGLNRKEPILARVVFLADPKTQSKQRLLLREMLLEGFAPATLAESLGPFAAEIRSKWAATRVAGSSSAERGGL